MRGNLTEAIWKLTYEEMEVLKEDNWINDVSSKLQVYTDRSKGYFNWDTRIFLGYSGHVV